MQRIGNFEHPRTIEAIPPNFAPISMKPRLGYFASTMAARRPIFSKYADDRWQLCRSLSSSGKAKVKPWSSIVVTLQPAATIQDPLTPQRIYAKIHLEVVGCILVY